MQKRESEKRKAKSEKANRMIGLFRNSLALLRAVDSLMKLVGGASFELATPTV